MSSPAKLSWLVNQTVGFPGRHIAGWVAGAVSGKPLRVSYLSRPGPQNPAHEVIRQWATCHNPHLQIPHMKWSGSELLVTTRTSKSSTWSDTAATCHGPNLQLPHMKWPGSELLFTTRTSKSRTWSDPAATCHGPNLQLPHMKWPGSGPGKRPGVSDLLSQAQVLCSSTHLILLIRALTLASNSLTGSFSHSPEWQQWL
jgi:hypothetical protein